MGKLLINENESHGSISSAYVSTISDLKMSVYNTINRNKSISDKRLGVINHITENHQENGDNFL